MNRTAVKTLLTICCLIIVTCTAMAIASRPPAPTPLPVPTPIPTGKGIVTLNGQLTQDKIFINGDGTVSVALTMTAADTDAARPDMARNVDLVVVLDRSGSMQGQKIEDARRAIHQLLADLTPADRFALVSYSVDVRRDAGLMPVTPANRNLLQAAVNNISADNGTNLGAGLQEGLAILEQRAASGNAGRLIIISDGLANHGVTEPTALAAMAGRAVANGSVVSAVGVGLDFNEYLMTAIADQGTGRYYYLEDAAGFARVFKDECRKSRIAAATGLEILIPLHDGITLKDAAGYPVTVQNNQAIFRPGDLPAGQSRKLFLTFQVPTHSPKSYAINGISLRYRYNGQPYAAALTEPLQVTCVSNKDEALASINKPEMENKVLQDDYNRLRDEVAQSINKGDQQDAMSKIEKFRADKKELNSVVGSGRIAESLDKDLPALVERVKETFAGAPAEVATKQKQSAKELQYKAYEGRRQ